MSHDELLYYDMLVDFVIFGIVKILTNHNMEVLFQINGRMNPAFCHGMIIKDKN